MKEHSLSHRRNIGLKRRYWAERRFRAYGLIAIFIGLSFLAILLWSVISRGYTAFFQSEMALSVYLDEKIIDPNGQRMINPKILMTANYPLLISNALATKLGVDHNDQVLMRNVSRMFSHGIRVQLRDMVIKNPNLIGTTQKIKVLAAADIDSACKGQINLHVTGKNRKIFDQRIEWMKHLTDDGTLYQAFNYGFFISGASSRPETSGLGVAIMGSLFMMIIVLMGSLPIGMATAIYLEEYGHKNKLTDLIEININNLAAVPSIIFGLLGLSVFINVCGMPRSASFVGGLVLTLMTLPTIIIATRSALRAVPFSIRAAALGLGASKTQMVFHHVVPLAAPGILTGTIIGLAQALGETAPLLLVGMVAFVANIPTTPMDPATALPVQIFMWAGEAERAFVEKTSGAIIVLMIFLAVMNIAAVLLRRRFERRW
ncbi:phosphate ABC transporter, permease PstA [Bartonella bacilliformis str. Heidi Mejia]|uniref:Phosphate transport system permease protein PstA n=2 Tax=Bartonella bacilliformis TaxID=774 RepID=A1UU25_BARBK|nr:phosphate ABC transporter permease PstA [Bartonella bacilliformis]ABM44848.1 phosphate ABC transporter, permease protein PstA [Bartonella bacilliformis KC583]AMG86210.1 phosphate ABC transporter, permease protein PstA [Bartonella bacilliformis]EKS43113.1 phosphate ABC transporter permease [Bartonella bacilliformis INS]EYS89004.1 phosphate ABC transporter, permease PstA [Bartonella bacilliformis San Pedro600-02]EYS90966.1 phosphate ABC transporter, permease PstA [Bartonella bacilliformis str